MCCARKSSPKDFQNSGLSILHCGESAARFDIKLLSLKKAFSQFTRSDRLAHAAVDGPLRLGPEPRKLSCLSGLNVVDAESGTFSAFSFVARFFNSPEGE
jgi:hypothetical protein